MKLVYIIPLIFMPPLSSQDSNQYLDFAWATYLQSSGKLSESLERYRPLLQQTQNPAVLKGYFQLLAAGNQWPAMIAMRTIIDTTLADEIKTQLLLAQAYAHTGNSAEMDKIILRLNSKYPENPDITLNTAQLYLRYQEPENALLTIDNYLKKASDKPTNFIFHFMKSQIYVLLGKKTQALTAVEKSIELYSTFDKSWLMYALLQEQAGNIKKALTGYISFVRETQDPTHEIQAHITKLLAQHNIPLAAVANQESCSERICSLIGQKKYDEAMQTALDFLKTNPNNEEVKLLAIDSIIGAKQYTKAIGILSQWAQENPGKELWFKTLYWIGLQTKEWLPILSVYQTVIKKHPHQLLSYLYASDAQLVLNKQADALHSLAKARDLAESPSLKAAILYQIALVHYKKKHFSYVKQCLKEACSLPTIYAPAFNLLAYYTAGKEGEIEKAESLIKQALSIDPNNPHYLDTRAYIFRKASEHDNALPFLQQAVSLAPRDPTIKCHLAKTYHALNNHEKAISLLDEVITITQDDTKVNKLKKLRDSWKIKK